MKSEQFVTSLAATTAAIATLATLATLLTGCGGPTSGELPAFDLAPAIDNPRPFDLTEIAEEIELIPLDDTQREGLLGDIQFLAESRGRFWVVNRSADALVKSFDRTGRFLSAVGLPGRGPDEFIGPVTIAPDRERDLVYLSGQMGSGHAGIRLLDGSGRVVARSDSIAARGGMVLHDGRLVLRRSSPRAFSLGNDPDFVTSIGTRVPLLDIYSPDLLEKLETVETIDKGAGAIIHIQNDASGNISSINVFQSAADIMSDAGDRLVVKEALSDTVMYYRDGALTHAYTLPMGRYAVPPESFGVRNTAPPDNGYVVGDVMDSDRWVLIRVASMISGSSTRWLVFDRRHPGDGFAATGPDGSSGLYLDGLPVTPAYIRDGRLTGYITALAIYDNADRLTHPGLKAVAQNIREDSNPVLVTAKLTD